MDNKVRDVVLVGKAVMLFKRLFYDCLNCSNANFRKKLLDSIDTNELGASVDALFEQ